jgi:antitoxin (DNA-binding transcriptional repressor) of toxin-antitoxin stability system
MKQIPAGEFKAHCLAIMDQVLHSGEPGKPVVRLVPAERQADEIFGHMAGKVKDCRRYRGTDHSIGRLGDQVRGKQ